MNITIGERCSGKTTELIKKSAATGARILTLNMRAAEEIIDRAKQMNLHIEHPVTIEQYLRGNVVFTQLDIRKYGLLIDDAELVLQRVFRDIYIQEIAMTDRGDNFRYLEGLMKDESKQSDRAW